MVNSLKRALHENFQLDLKAQVSALQLIVMMIKLKERKSRTSKTKNTLIQMIVGRSK